MQFFPADATSATDIAANLFSAQSSAFSSETKHASFDSILGSFIEEGRSVYAGRPAGFSNSERETGTLDETQTKEVVGSLRKRKVDEETLNGLDQLLASGAPVTVSRLINAVSGMSRKSPALEGEERDALNMLLGKLGFDKNEVEEMMALSDDGKTAAVWKKLSGHLSKMEGTTDVTKTEFSALLKGLDISEESQKILGKLFGEGSEQKLSGPQLDTLLSPIGKEYILREKNSEYARTQVRAAVEEALKAAKAKEQGAPVEDLRGNRRSEQTEAFMQNSVLKKTGATDIKRDQTGKEDDAAGQNRRESKTPLGQGLGVETDAKTTRQTKAEEKPVDKISQLLHRIDVAGEQPRTNETAGQAQNLNNLAKNFRQEIFSQVENGILQNSQNGARQLTLQLNPGELGQLTVLLSVRQGEVSATIRTENQDTSSAIREQLVELKASLEAQGLKVKELDVQTQLRDNSSADQWNRHQEHNLMRDSSERDRFIRLSRMQRGAGDIAGGTETLDARAHATESTGLHIVA